MNIDGIQVEVGDKITLINVVRRKWWQVWKPKERKEYSHWVVTSEYPQSP